MNLGEPDFFMRMEAPRRLNSGHAQDVFSSQSQQISDFMSEFSQMQSINLEFVKALNKGVIRLEPEDAQDEKSSPVLFLETDSTQWAYSACLESKHFKRVKVPCVLHIKIKISSGSIGVGVLKKGSSSEYKFPEKILDAHLHPVEVMFVLSDTEKVGHLIFRNCAEQNASCGIVYAITMRSFVQIEASIPIPGHSIHEAPRFIDRPNPRQPPIVHFLAPADQWSRRLLCITHTQRKFELERGSRTALLTRYGNPMRLPPSIPFHALKHALNYSPWKGQITVWSIDPAFRKPPELVAQLQTLDYKPQHALWFGGRLWVLGTEQLEVFDRNMNLVSYIEDPWLSGAHTLVPNPEGKLLVSCSASDAILFIDSDQYAVTNAVRFPESLYGFNYRLSRTDSVVEHYIYNDLQLTHVNAAWPWRDGVLVSTLIQGAIGWFDKHLQYREFLRGHIGCHGIRINAAGRPYFCDTSTGKLIFLSEEFKVQFEYQTDSCWLHDAQEIVPGLYALALGDRNVIEFVKPELSTPLYRMDCSSFGQGTQFISYGQ